MDLRTLTYFVTVAEELNITRAAERLHMCQPPLSSQIKNLEKELNTILFIRGKRHLQLTESGQLLYRRAKEILNLADKAESEIISMSSGMTGVISIGLTEGLAPEIAAEWIHEFTESHPSVRFRVYDANSDELIKLMRSGIISLAVITAPCDQLLLHSFMVGQEKVCAFMRKDHPLAMKEGSTVSIADMKDEKLITAKRQNCVDRVYKWYREYDAEPDIVCGVDSYLDVVAMAERGIGIGIFPKTAYVPKDELVIKELEGDDKSLEYLFVWRQGHPLPTVEETFIDYVKEKVGVESDMESIKEQLQEEQ